MVKNAHPAIRIDLNEFKLHIDLKKGSELTLHFNSPSRMFYLSVIALVVHEMKRLGKVTSIPLEKHLDLLVLLNESVGGSAGSSDKKNLSQRIYRKWKGALPNLEEAPLYKVLGRKKEYDEWIGKTYLLTEAEKDSWANLFEYKGSEENVRLKFSIDKIGASLDDVVIVYEDALDGDAWERFLSSLKGQVESVPEMEAVQSLAEVPVAPASPIRKQRTVGQSRQFWVVLVTMIVVIAGVAAMAIWKLHLRPASVRVASKEKMAFPLPDEPSIAVLPFVNMSEDPKQEFLSDGITEAIITALSKVRHLFVISRQSTFSYKGKPVKVKQVSEELGVQYVLEGSVQRSADRIRINAQLIDALTGRHIWAERYDRDLTDIFALQDEITIKILTAVQVKLTEGEQASTFEKYSKGKQGLDCYLKIMEAKNCYWGHNIRDTKVLRQLSEEAIAMCPETPMAYVMMGLVNQMESWLGIGNPRESIEQGIKMAQKALAIDDSTPLAHSLLSIFYTLKREYDKSIAEGERAVALDPGSSDAQLVYGMSLNYSGRSEEAIPIFVKAIRLNPLGETGHFIHLAIAYRATGRYEEAVSANKKALQRSPDNIFAHLNLAANYILMDQEEEARAEAAEVLRINPKFSLDSFAKIIPFKDQSVIDNFINALRKAGLK